MTLTERLNIIATNTEPSNKHVIWLKNNMLYRWAEYGWKPIGGASNQSGTTDYNELINKPSINGITLKGNIKLNLEGYTKEEIDSKFNSIEFPEVNLDDYYNKQEIDNIINRLPSSGSTNVSDVYKVYWASYNADTFEELKSAATAGKTILVNDSFLGVNINVYTDSVSIGCFILDHSDTDANVLLGTFNFHSDGNVTMNEYIIVLTNKGKGDKFLSDDGTYKTPTISGGSTSNGAGVDLSLYYTKEEIDNKGYLTEVPDEYAKIIDLPSVDDFVTEEIVDQKIANAKLEGGDVDLTGYATEIWVNQQGFLKEVPSDYITEQELNSKHFALASDLNKYQLTIDDLETIRQGASKGATALQSYTEQYKGTVTGVKINNSTKSPVSGIVDLGTVITSHQDISGKQDRITIVEHGTSDTTFTMTPNVLHKWDVIDSLVLTFPMDEGNYVNSYKAVFTAASDSFSLALPYYYKWVNDEVPIFEEGMQYEISFEGARVLWSKFVQPVKFGLLEYAESDGVDYVLTDIILDSRIYGFKHKSAPLFAPGGSSNVALAGTRSASGQANTIFTMWYRGSTSDRRAFWDGKSTTFSAYEEGVLYEDSLENSQLTLSCDYPLMLFAQNANGRADYKGKMRLYYLQFLDANGEVIIDLRPWRRKEDGHVGIMDIISNKFYESVNGNLVGA